VRESLDASSYEIVTISIDTGGGEPTPIFRQQEMAVMSVPSRAAPALEGGTTRIQISVRGTIELD